MSTNRKETSVLRASGSISLITFISRILGMIRDAVIARYFGAGLYTDAFYAAFKIPNLLRRLVAEGSLTTAFVPIFTDELKKGDDHARIAIRSATSFVLLLTVVLTILGMVFSKELTLLFAPGWESDSEKGEIAAQLLAVMFPYLIVVSLTALTTSALNCLQVFAMPTFAQAILNIGMIASALLSTVIFVVPIFGLAWGVLVGGTLALLPQIIMLKRLGFPIGFGSLKNSQSLSRLIRLMLPSVVSSSLYQFMIFINLVLASMLQEGSVSWLYYGDRLFQFPLGVFTLAVAQAVLPTLSKLAANHDELGFSRQLTKALNWITLICIPAAVGLILLAEPITKLIYQGGTFSSKDSEMTAIALQAYAIGLWALSAQSILVRAFLAHKQAIFPAVISSIAMVINIFLAFVLMGEAVNQPTSAWGSAIYWIQSSLHIFSLGHVGLALSGSLAAFFALIWLCLALKRIDVKLDNKRLLSCSVKAVVASAVMGLGILFAQQFISSSFLLISLTLPLSVAVYALILKKLNCDEVVELSAMILSKFRAK